MEQVQSLHVLSLNCFGLKVISKYRSERLSEIGSRIAAYSPALDIVGLQEVWTFSDYLAIREKTRNILPYAKFYNSGIFGGGLAIFSKWPIQDSTMYRYPLNGRPTAFFRGDWFVGKGVACTTIRLPNDELIEVFNTHLHAPYEREPNDSYLCHRTAQAWEIAKLMRQATERGSLVLGLGDFNMIPKSFAHVLIESRGKVKDVWRILKPTSSIGASIDEVEIERRRLVGEKPSPTVFESLQEHGHTCDTVLNTFRWTKAQQKALAKGHDRTISDSDLDEKAKRLDYIFFGGLERGWQVVENKVTLTERHPTLRCSLSDHFAVETTIVRSKTSQNHFQKDNPDSLRDGNDSTIEDNTHEKGQLLQPVTFKHDGVDHEFYNKILDMIEEYATRERKQRRYRTLHFPVSAVISIGCFIAIWWSPRNFVAFLLILLSTFGIMAGVVDGLIGGLFVGSELRALAEFEWEVRNAFQRAGGPVQQDKALRDWYD